MIQIQMHGLQESKLYAWITFKLRFWQSFEKIQNIFPHVLFLHPRCMNKIHFYYSAVTTGEKQETYCEELLLAKSPAITYTHTKKMSMRKK